MFYVQLMPFVTNSGKTCYMPYNIISSGLYPDDNNYGQRWMFNSQAVVEFVLRNMFKGAHVAVSYHAKYIRNLDDYMGVKPDGKVKQMSIRRIISPFLCLDESLLLGQDDKPLFAPDDFLLIDSLPSIHGNIDMLINDIRWNASFGFSFDDANDITYITMASADEVDNTSKDYLKDAFIAALRTEYNINTGTHNVNLSTFYNCLLDELKELS